MSSRRDRAAALLFAYLYDVAIGALVAAPLASLLADAVSNQPAGEKALYRDGALALVELFNRSHGAIVAMGSHVFGWGVAGALAGLVPMGAMVVAFGGGAQRGGLLARSVALLPRFGALLAAFTFIEALLAAAAFFVFSTASAGGAVGTEVASTKRALLLLVPFAVALFVLAAIHDLARLGAAQSRSTLGGLRLGLAALRHHPALLLSAYAATLAVTTLLAGAGVAATRAVPHSASTALFVAIAVAHQLVLFGRAGVRGIWLARAARTIDAPQDEGDTSER